MKMIYKLYESFPRVLRFMQNDHDLIMVLLLVENHHFSVAT